jgi:hypothetical protein
MDEAQFGQEFQEQGYGEACKLAAGTLHCERSGAIGATILIGKK